MRKQIQAVVISIAILFCISATLVSPSKKTETKVFVSNSGTIIKSIIDNWSKYGYRVESLTPQSVAVSINNHLLGSSEYEKGDLILIMTKDLTK